MDQPPATEALQRWREIAARPSMFDLTGRSVGRVVTRRRRGGGPFGLRPFAAGGHGPGPGRRRRQLPRALPGGTVAITHNGHSIYPFPDSRPGSGGPLLPPPLRSPFPKDIYRTQNRSRGRGSEGVQMGSPSC